MGVGGGFIMVPAMIYLLGMPTKVVIGTSLFQIIFVTAFTTMLHATTNFTVDIVLAVLLLVGGVIGAQVGARIGVKMKAGGVRSSWVRVFIYAHTPWGFIVRAMNQTKSHGAPPP